LDRASGANELWLVDTASTRARRLASGLNTIGAGYAWLPDSRGLLVHLRSDRARPLPPADAVPTGPAIQHTEAGAGVRSVRTYQDLLRNESDAQTLEHYLLSQLARIDLGGKVPPLGAPALYLPSSPSPDRLYLASAPSRDGRYVLATQAQRPFSYLVPVTRFPRVVEVLDARTGASVHTVARLPLVEGLPTGNDAVPTGARHVHWRADAPATL